MKKNIKTLIVSIFILVFGIFGNTYYCFAQTRESTASIPVSGRIIFNENINSNIPNKDDVQGTFPIKPHFNPDKNLVDIPKTGDTGYYIYWLVLILAVSVLIWQYRRQNIFEKEDLENEKKKDNSIN